jgi:hypothetical protein
MRMYKGKQKADNKGPRPGIGARATRVESPAHFRVVWADVQKGCRGEKGTGVRPLKDRDSLFLIGRVAQLVAALVLNGQDTLLICG